MIFLFRFYNIVEEEIDNNLFKENKLRRARYIDSNFNKTKNLKIYEHISNKELEIAMKDKIIKSFGKYIEIDGRKYFRSSKDYLDKCVYNTRCCLEIPDEFCQIVVNINNDSYTQKYNNYNDLYIVFKSFEEFYLWYKKNKAELDIKIFKKDKYRINNKNLINTIFSKIEDHFNSNEENILLFRIVFRPKKYKTKI